jgi:hypothetical protein
MPVSWNGLAVLKAVDHAVDVGLASLCNDIVETAKAKMREPKTGIDYRKKWRRAGKKMPGKGKSAGYFKRVSSAPGEAPAVQSGDLFGHINMEKLGHQAFAVGTDLKHGAWMEVGVPKGIATRIKPRPYLRPAVYEHTGRDAEVHFAGKVP